MNIEFRKIDLTGRTDSECSVVVSLIEEKAVGRQSATVTVNLETKDHTLAELKAAALEKVREFLTDAADSLKTN